jgi:site-specific recombinase XerD
MSTVRFYTSRRAAGINNFCFPENKRIRGIQKRIEYYAKKTRVNVSCHRLRHTMATQLLNAEAEVETIQDLLGHNWITTTQRYCRVSNLKVQRDYFKAMRNVLQRSAQPSLTQIFDPGG